jgi:hypothetical protein
METLPDLQTMLRMVILGFFFAMGFLPLLAALVWALQWVIKPRRQ